MMEGFGQVIAGLTNATLALYGEPEPHGADLTSDIASRLHTLAKERRAGQSAGYAPGTIVVRGREVMVLNFAGQWLAPGVAAPMPVGPDATWDVLRDGYGPPKKWGQ